MFRPLGVWLKNCEAGLSAEIIMEVMNAAEQAGYFTDQAAALSEIGRVMSEPFIQANGSRRRFDQEKRFHAPARYAPLSKRQQSVAADTVALQEKKETGVGQYRGGWRRTSTQA